MKIEYTQKLYFGKFSYKISVEVSGTAHKWWHQPAGVPMVQDWCSKHLNTSDHKLICRRQTHDSKQRHAVWHVCIYCARSDLKDKILKQFGAHVVQINQPLDNDHLANLSVKNIIQVRSQLIYKQFSHVIYFKYDRSGTMHKWLKQYFKGNPDARVSGSLWWSKVYTKDVSDILTIQMSWPDQIDYIKTVRLIAAQP